MQGPRIKLDYEVDVLYLRPGETLTVYMGRHDEQASQVELRMFPDGTKEIWARSDVAICDWETGIWTSMDQ